MITQPNSPNPPTPTPKKMRPSGGYRELRSFQTTTLIYDATVLFCDTHIDRRSRTHDQMVQAARSGRQNIAEGNRMGSTSSKSELQLTNVARASLEELLLDFQDFLRQRDLPLWPKDSPNAATVRALSKYPTDQSDLTDPQDAGDRARAKHYAPALRQQDPAATANALICLIHQANYLLDQQIAAMEQAFIEGGGATEQLATARMAHRRGNQSNQSDQTDPIPPCPTCGKQMALRTAKQGKNAGSQFWGCTGYPDCKGAVPL